MINANKSKLVLVTFSPFRRKLILIHANYFTLKTVKQLFPQQGRQDRMYKEQISTEQKT